MKTRMNPVVLYRYTIYYARAVSKMASEQAFNDLGLSQVNHGIEIYMTSNLGGTAPDFSVNLPGEPLISTNGNYLGWNRCSNPALLVEGILKNNQ
jgi:hypothetical protein